MKPHVDELAGMVGREFPVTDWLTIDQDRINRFADAIDDHQWIHVDAERAKAGPFGATIAHGYLTLSLLSIFLDPILDFDGLAMRVNYGLDRIRFPAAVPVNSRIRAHVTVESVNEGPQGIRVVLRCVLEMEGNDKPACVAHPVALLVRSDAAVAEGAAS